jgi:hypothetical protein
VVMVGAVDGGAEGIVASTPTAPDSCCTAA